MAKEIFPGQIDLKRVKFLIEQTKFWPVYERDTVYSKSSSSGSVDSSGTGETWNPTLEEWLPTSSAGSSVISSEQEGEADIPVVRSEPFKEISSITPYPLDEILWELSDRLMEQYQRHFMIRRPGKPTRAAVTPFVTSWGVRPERIRAYTERLREKFLTANEVDQALFDIHNRLSLAATGRPLQKDEKEKDPSRDEEGDDIAFEGE
jgi:hypothetical protein